LLYCDMCQPSGVDTWQTVSFWTKNLTEALIWSFLKIEVSFMMRIETQVLKNKVSKTQEPKVYLIIFFQFSIILNDSSVSSVKHYQNFLNTLVFIFF